MPDTEDTKLDLSDDETRETAESAVIHPATVGTQFAFMGKTITLRALPIFYAKKISASLEGFKQKVADIATQAKKGKETDISDVDMDDETIEALLQCAEVICDFYKLDLSREAIEKEASVSDLTQLAAKQLEVNGKSDFLLTPLKLITGLSGMVAEAYEAIDKTSLLKEVNLPQSSSFTNPSAMDGESRSTS